MDKETLMALSARKARENVMKGIGGPFGAAITRYGEILCIESNTVLGDHDPTAHAEINAIRAACNILGTHDLSDCELYATGYPCPMCLGAIMWAGIKKVYVSALPEDAEAVGFKDAAIYRYIMDHKCESSKPDERLDQTLTIQYLDREIGKGLLDDYAKAHRTMY